ncbi:MAG: hypothetical protein RLZZ303_2357 [Candidatus Hydrogenedentota bacterium]
MLKSVLSRRGCLTAFLLLVGLALIGLFWLRERAIGPYHDYELNVLAPSPEHPTVGDLQAGVAVEDISPPESLYDPWTDLDGNRRFNAKVDTWEDRNANGRFDPIWLAGFEPGRAASGLAQPLDARALALRNNAQLVVMVTADMIGIEHNEVLRIREMVSPSLGIDHILISATHTHEVPDPIGMWSSPVPFISFDPAYMAFVRERIVAAIERAVLDMVAVDMHCAVADVPQEGFVRDSRKPEMIVPWLYAFEFSRKDGDGVLATFVSWGNHPEALGGTNPLITPDFPYWLRKGMEEGVPGENGSPGFGGVCLYFQGVVGGLMTQLEMAVPHRDGERSYLEDSFEKAQALGENTAVLAATALRGPERWHNAKPMLAWSARTVKAPLQPLFRAVVGLGLMHRGYYPGGLAKSEINVLRIGGVLMLATPGEIYPELVIGGVEALPGRDFEIDPVEVPPLLDQMHGRMNLVLGLANDFIGYIIPKSQWDTRAPYVYDDAPQYGEWMSSGPEVGPVIHAACSEALADFQRAHPWDMDPLP